MNGISILIVDDEALIRDGLTALLEKEECVSKILHAWNMSSLEQQLKNSIDVVLLDIRLKGNSGLDMIPVIRKNETSPKIITITGLEGVELMLNLLKLGVDGIVFKLDGYQDIWDAINKVVEGDNYYPERVLRIIQDNASNWDEAPPVTLNFTEKELLVGVAQGLTNKQIAVALKMSPSTIETYRIRLIKKLQVGNTASLMAYAYRNGLL
jgi:DNA-binding NarL/FixJ family response regulator